MGDVAESSVVPPLEAKCSRGPKKRCKRKDEPREDWHFDYPSPDDDPLWAWWRAKNRELPDEPYFHYKFGWEIEGSRCRYWATAYGDLDDDGSFSTYERSYISYTDETGKSETLPVVRNWNG